MEFKGERQEFEESVADLGRAFVVAVLLIRTLPGYAMSDAQDLLSTLVWRSHQQPSLRHVHRMHDGTKGTDDVPVASGDAGMPKGGFEPPRLIRHHPLKMACLPSSTTSAWVQIKVIGKNYL